jgi:hypothetical protein
MAKRRYNDWWGRDRPRVAWVLIDKSNSNERSRNYLWWFETRAIARRFLLDHRKESKRLEKERGFGLSDLFGPFQYRLVERRR